MNTIQDMNIVQELIYIVGGIIIAYMITEGSKLLKVILNGKSISATHLIYSSIAPFVVWQFIYQLIRSLDETQLDEKYAFGVSFLAILNMTILIMMAALIYPPSVKEYTTENVDFREHLKESRRAFYLLISIFLITITINNIVLEDGNLNPGILMSRLIIFLFVIICAFLNFELNVEDNTRINTNIRYIRFCVKKTKFGFRLKTKPIYLLIYKFNASNREDKIDNFYDRLDIFTAIITLVGFIAIIVFRYYS